MRNYNSPADIGRDALSLYEKVKKSRAGEQVQWASGAYDNERRKKIAIDSFIDARCDMGAFDNVFATVLKEESGLTDAEFHKAYGRHFPYQEPPPEAWRAAMFVSAYLVDADAHAMKSIGLAVHLPNSACAFDGWHVDSQTIGLLLGTQDYRMASIGDGDWRGAIYYAAPNLLYFEEGEEYNFMAIGPRDHLTGKAIIIGYCVAADQHEDVHPDLEYRVAFYRAKFVDIGPLEYGTSGDPTLIVDVLDP
jgi:hypothetical protein